MPYFKEEIMPPVRFVRPVAATVLVVLLLAALGCTSQQDAPDHPSPKAPAAQTVSESEPQSAESTKPTDNAESPVESKLPVTEFQQPAVVPASDPLPQPMIGDKPAAPLTEPAERNATPQPVIANEGTTEPVPEGDEQPSDPASHNPLRDGNASNERPAPIAIPEQPAVADQAPAGEQVSQPPPGRPSTGKNSGIPFDPIKENGPIFVDWPKPKVAMIITGMESGYLEPCGCAGLDRMKGGMARRATLFKELREDGWPVLGLDVGGLVHGFGRQAELKYQTAVEGKRKAGYNAIAFGTDDLRLPAGELVAVAADVDGNPSPFLAANVGLLGHPGDITAQARVLQANGMKVGVTAILGREYQKEIHNDEIELLDPDAALEQVVPELKQKSDYLVLLAHATMEESVELAKKFPAFNVVVTSAVPPEEPPRQPETIPGTNTLLICVGYKGMNAIVLGLYDDPAQPWRYQRVPLDSRFAASPDMKTLMEVYQEQLKAIGFAGLGLRPVPHPLAETNGRFIGSKKCATCHEKSYDIWKKTGHAKAYETLEKLNPPRHFDPECISCHVIGWHPTRYFPYAGGYESAEKTPELIDVGCEDCHGPGEKHAAAESGGDTALQETLRKAMVITKAESKKQQCYSCHDLDNSPDFDFDKYWPFVEHYEKDE